MYLISIISAFIMNICNIFEVQELAVNKDNYKPYQAMLVSTFTGLLFSVIAILFVEVKMVFTWILLYHAVVWLIQVLLQFTMATRLNPVTFRVLKGTILPITMLLDIAFGNIRLTPLVILGGVIIFISVSISVIRDRNVIKSGLNGLGLISITALTLFLMAYIKVLKYQIRTNYGIDAISFLFVNALIALPIYMVFLIITKRFKPRSIVENRHSHFRAGMLSMVQQVLGIVVLGYIPATYLNLLTGATSYLAVPISKRSKDENVNCVDSKAHYYFLANFIGTLLIVLS